MNDIKAHEKYNICKEIMLELIFNCPPKSINNKKTVVLNKKKRSPVTLDENTKKSLTKFLFEFSLTSHAINVHQVI